MHNDFSPIHICAARSKTACIEALWKFGAKLNVRTGSGILPKDLTPDSTCRNLILRLEGNYSVYVQLCFIPRKIFVLEKNQGKNN